MVLTWKHTISVCCIIVNRFLWKRTYSTLVKIYIRLNENSFENEASSIHRLQYSMLHGLFPCDNMLGYLVYYWSSNRIKTKYTKYERLIMLKVKSVWQSSQQSGDITQFTTSSLHQFPSLVCFTPFIIFCLDTFHE